MDSFNTAVNCGSFLLPWNAIMLALGILIAVIVTEIIVKKRGLYKDLALDACIVGIPCGLVGGRLFSALSGKIAFSSFLNLSETGMNLPGALLFAGIGILIYLKIKKLSIRGSLDVMMPGTFFGLAIGRWSDFFLCDGLGKLAGAGIPKFFPLVTFTNAYFHDRTTVAYAIFFLDFVICAALGIVALILYKKRTHAGRVACITTISYLFAEFILEWLREGEARQIVFGEMRFNQLVLIGTLLTVVVFVVIEKNQKQPVSVVAEYKTVNNEEDASQKTEITDKDEQTEETQAEAEQPQA